LAAAVLTPHFDAVRDLFAAYRPASGEQLTKMRKVQFVIDPAIHDSERHFAATLNDGLLMGFSPLIVDLPVETLVAIVTHEFGHAADFAFPGSWMSPMEGPGEALWLGPVASQPDRKMRKLAGEWHKLWDLRNRRAHAGDRTPTEKLARDQVEWAADAIAFRVTGQRLGYCGPCLLQCLRAEAPDRPAGLR
jgi:hypothetical protein